MRTWTNVRSQGNALAALNVRYWVLAAAERTGGYREAAWGGWAGANGDTAASGGQLGSTYRWSDALPGHDHVEEVCLAPPLLSAAIRNLCNLKVDPRGYFDALAAVEDAANTLVVWKDYAAPGKPEYVVRYGSWAAGVEHDALGLSDPQAAEATGAGGGTAVPLRLADQLPEHLEQPVEAVVDARRASLLGAVHALHRTQGGCRPVRTQVAPTGGLTSRIRWCPASRTCESSTKILTVSMHFARPSPTRWSRPTTPRQCRWSCSPKVRSGGSLHRSRMRQRLLSLTCRRWWAVAK